MAVTTVAPMPTAGDPGPRRWTIEEFERLPDDLFPEGERAELIDGLIYTKMGQNDPHYFALHFTIEALRAVFGSGYAIVTQAPTRFADRSKVEPDVLVLRGSLREYQGKRVDPSTDVVLLVEISDTSLGYDQATKAILYATQGVPEYWIVNLQNRTLEVRRLSPQGTYGEVTVYSEGESLAVAEGQVAVSELMPAG